MRRLPPLNSLRAFEAAARHLSFTKAADELSVTPGAISQQVKLLEETIGLPLFHRTARGLTLTEAGTASLPTLRDGFDRLDTAVRLMALDRGAGRLAVSVAPSFASKWLVPRLDRFQALYPDIDVYIHAAMEVIDFSIDDVDAAIRYGRGDYGDLVTERLMGERIVPVCAPSLVTGNPPLKTPADLAHHTLLHDDGNDNEISTWPMWLKAAGTNVDGTRGPRFNQSSIVLEAAVAGRGVALAKYALAEADLQAARLLIPFDLKTPTDFAYWLVYPAAKAALPEVKAFREWIMGQVGNASR